MTRVDLSLRQAIVLNDVALVERILKNNPSILHNPDFADKSNTSLHLAARYGLEEIAVGPRNVDDGSDTLTAAPRSCSSRLVMMAATRPKIGSTATNMTI
jgi:hypothetical protein